MIENLSSNLVQYLQNGEFSLLFLLISFLGGVLASISPCSIGVLPLIIGYVGGYGDTNKLKTFLQLLSFVLGLSFVLSAIGEVENALAQINYLKREYDKRTDVVKASLKVQDLTQTQYDHGYIDYFSVSDAQRLALSNERAQISLRGDRFKAYVNLISALGGGWVADVQKQDEELRPDLLDPYELSKDNPKPLGEE